MKHRKPDYNEIRRLEHELGLDDDGLVNEELVEDKPTPPPPSRRETLRESVRHRKLSEHYAFYPAFSSTSMAPLAHVNVPARKTVTIYGPDGKPLYDTPAA